MIFQLVTPPQTRDGLYGLMELTHVCRFWRVALINQPRMWSTLFITQKDRRTFIEACLERSRPAGLNVTVDAGKDGRIHSGCTCDKGCRGRLLPNESNPCEWHFQFESLAETKHSNRIHALEICFDGRWIPMAERARFRMGACRFFTSPFPQLVALTWRNEESNHVNHLFSIPPFVPTLRSLTYVGAWSGLIAQVNNLTSFAFESCFGHTSTEAVRLLMHNNRSLVSLALDIDTLEGDPKGPPVHLPNLEVLTIDLPVNKKLSTIFRVPALQRLSSLRISSEDAEMYTMSATGDRIALTVKCSPRDFAETWEDLTGYAKPVVRHIRLYDGPDDIEHYFPDNNTIVLLMLDAQTLEVGYNYMVGWDRGFWGEVKQLGTQLKTIRFEVSGEMECVDDDEWDVDDEVWDNIEDLVKYRFDQGRPFSTVGRLVVSGSDRDNRMQDYAWRCFYGCRKVGQYVRPA